MKEMSRGCRDGLTKTVGEQCADDAVARERCDYHLCSSRSGHRRQRTSPAVTVGKGGEGEQSYPVTPFSRCTVARKRVKQRRWRQTRGMAGKVSSLCRVGDRDVPCSSQGYEVTVSQHHAGSTSAR